MSVRQAKKYIRRLRTEVPLRQQFELVWQGKRSNPDDIYTINGEPVVPRLLPSSIPDSKVDPSGYRRFWSITNAQQDMHDLLFSNWDGQDHAQRYLDGDTITNESIQKVIDKPEMEAVLQLLADIANACCGYEISLADMNEAWHCYVQWVYKIVDYAGRHDEVQRLRMDVVDKLSLRTNINDLVSSKDMPLGVASLLGFYMQTGFTNEGAYEGFEEHKALIESVVIVAKEAGYNFSALDYLNDCIHKQAEDDSGPELDDRYWPEDDPNRWNYKSNAPVLLSL